MVELLVPAAGPASPGTGTIAFASGDELLIPAATVVGPPPAPPINYGPGPPFLPPLRYPVLFADLAALHPDWYPPDPFEEEREDCPVCWADGGNCI